MCAKNVEQKAMTVPADLKLNPRMNILSGVHSHQNLRKRPILLNLKTINGDSRVVPERKVVCKPHLQALPPRRASERP